MIWSSTSAPFAQQSRQRIAHMPMSRADRRDLRWCMAIAFVLPFVVAALSTLRWS